MNQSFKEHRSPKKARGSSMTEFAVLTLAMLPVMIGIPMVGKMIDLKQTTINASRYAAWQATVTDSYDAAEQIDSRFFQKSETQIKTQTVKQTGNRLWGETSSVAPNSYMEKGAVRISNNSAAAKALEVNISNSVSSGASAGVEFGGVVKEVGDILSWAPGTDWGLSGDGLLRAAVQVKVKQNHILNESDSACFVEGEIYACMTAANSIMVDSWSAGSDYQAARRTRSFVPSTAIRDVSDILAAIGEVPVFAELKGLKRRNGNFGFGHVDMKPLPRLLEDYSE